MLSVPVLRMLGLGRKVGSFPSGGVDARDEPGEGLPKLMADSLARF
jgi:hypothetical protein